jgi:hypothetical protein
MNNKESIENQINEIIILIKDYKDDSLVMNFLKSWKDNLSLIKDKIKKEELSEKDRNEIKEISSQVINSLILKWTIPHKKLENLLNLLTYKNKIIQEIEYNQNNNDETSIIEQINNIVKTLKKYNHNKVVVEFIEFWDENSALIKQKIKNNQLSVDDIREIKNIINEVVDSLSFYFTIPHEKLEILLNILTVKNKLYR